MGGRGAADEERRKVRPRLQRPGHRMGEEAGQLLAQSSEVAAGEARRGAEEHQVRRRGSRLRLIKGRRLHSQ